jgi:DNA replication protein
MAVRAFAGFPAGTVRSTPIPDLFFSGLLPQMDDLAELKVVLHCFWALQRKDGFPRFIARREMESDATLMRSLHLSIDPSETVLRQALDRATERRAMLRLDVEGNNGVIEEIYFLNTARSREAVAKIRAGELDIGPVVVTAQGDLPNRNSDLFTLYEQNIGLLTPMLAEELTEAERTYPKVWLEDAVRIAVEYNRRNWRYIKRILERWAIEGKDGQTPRRSS